MWQILVFSFMLPAVLGFKTTEVSQCLRNAGDLPINVYIEGCEVPPCQLPQQQDAVLNIVFRAPRTMKSMRTMATAYVGILPVPYSLGDNAVTCDGLTNTYCPVYETEVVQYTLRMYILSIFPTGQLVTLEFYVQDTTTSPYQPVFCLRVPITVVPPIEQISYL